MAGTVVVTTSNIGAALSRDKNVKKYSIAWTSDGSGAVNGNAFAIDGGTILSVAFTPGAAALQPDDQYDVTLKCMDHNVADVLGGAGGNLSNAAGSHGISLHTSSSIRQWLHGGSYDLIVAAAGAANSGTVDLYIQIGAI